MKEKIDKRIEMALQNLDIYAECGGVFHDMTGRTSPISGKGFCRLCEACVKHQKAGDFCRHNATSGAYQAMVSGTIHYSKCWLGLFNLIAPVSPDGQNIIGTIEIGGLLPPGKLQEVQHNIIATLSAIDDDENLPHFINALQGLEEMPSIDIENLKSFIRETMFSTGLLNSESFETNAAIWNQQTRLASVATRIENLTVFDRREKVLQASNLLLKTIDSGNNQAIQEQVDEVLSIAVTGEPNDLKSVKAFLLPVISAIAMNDLLRQEKWSKVMMQHTLRIDEMAEIDNQKELCFWFESIIIKLFRQSENQAAEELLSEKVIAYLHKHFSENIQLDEASKSIAASTSSIMHKLKKETGKTFSQHLNAIRIKEAKRLLTFTSLPLGEISIRCGFKDQSYFTKVFTKNINIGPREFRNMLTQETR
jgi:two-component system, response regulator YesN